MFYNGLHSFGICFRTEFIQTWSIMEHYASACGSCLNSPSRDWTASWVYTNCWSCTVYDVVDSPPPIRTVLLQILGQAMHQILNSITCQPQHWGNTPSRSPWHFLMCRTLGSGLQLLWLCMSCWETLCPNLMQNTTQPNTKQQNLQTQNGNKQMHVHKHQIKRKGIMFYNGGVLFCYNCTACQHSQQTRWWFGWVLSS